MIVILGGGISGLLAAWAFRRKQPTLIERSPSPGGAYLAGGLKYIRETVAMRDMFDALGVKWEPYTPVGGLLWRGVLHPYPQWFNGLSPEEQHEIRSLHWAKTRGTADVSLTCMNDPAGEAATQAMKADLRELLARLADSAEANGAVLCDTAVLGIESAHVVTSRGTIPYRKLVPTLPMPVLGALAPWLGLPAAHHTQLGIIEVTMDGCPPAAAFDYIYTPEHTYVTRISRQNGATFQLEVRSPTPLFHPILEGLSPALEEDARVISTPKSIPGHLLPLGRPPAWPDNWLPLGRYAAWEPRMTAEKVLDRATETAGA